ncbi:MAG: Trimeric GatFAB AmidoTransferase(AdT) complex subunit [Chrysothrix sp. TS-e1954]|nr:MAG: Trimeric GatFAB AmidoTransferase(AdT) complex subunit [Chrysothrix sp. TS-e1954]
MRKVTLVRTRVARFSRSSRLLRDVTSLNAFIHEPIATGPSRVNSSDADSNSALHGTSVGIKDNICTKDLPTTCGSWGLRDYSSSYDATVVSKLRDVGAVIAGKTNLDEFGMGSHSVHSAFGPVKTTQGHSAGGSSGGSAMAVATGQVQIALGTDTGGSIRLPSAYNGVFGFKPSYGRLSRCGVVAYANSLDTVGILAKDIGVVRKTYAQLDCVDVMDPTSLSPSTRSRLARMIGKRDDRKKLRFGVPKEYNIEELSLEVRIAWSQTLNKLKEAGGSIHTVSLPTTSQALSAYYVLAPAEASSNLAKYDSVRYGSRPEVESANGLLFSNARRHGLGEEVRRRILLGSYSLSAEAIDNYFIQAQKVRRLVQRDFDRVFSLPNVLANDAEALEAKATGVDAIICPTAPTLPPMLDEVLARSSIDAYADDVFTVPASLAGLPAISVPVHHDHGPAHENDSSQIGMQVITQYGDDELALSIADMM